MAENARDWNLAFVDRRIATLELSTAAAEAASRWINETIEHRTGYVDRTVATDLCFTDGEGKWRIAHVRAAYTFQDGACVVKNCGFIASSQ